jgi:hypothetical protein
MTLPAERFPFVPRDPALGTASLAPLLRLTLTTSTRLDVFGLLGSGAAVNVLPFAVGVALGFDWDSQTIPVQLSGNISAVEARVIVVAAVVGRFPPVQLAFGWAKSDDIPIILGQVNFFLEFDVCFFRSEGTFEIQPKR